MSQTQSRVFRTHRGARIVQHGTVLSEVLGQPGPTHSVADVLASVVNLAKAHGTVAMLGFAGGGMVAPLRALGGTQSIDAVDLCDRHFNVFQDLCRDWCGAVRFHHAEAASWLRQTSVCYDLIIEDLSVAEGGDVVKPEVSWKELPGLMRRRLVQNGTALFNLLRPKTMSWETFSLKVMGPGRPGLWIVFDDFENRLLVTGKGMPSAREYSRQLRAQLTRLKSRLADRIKVRTLNHEGIPS